MKTMKKLQHILFLALAGGALLLSACREDEKLGLEGVAGSSLGMTIDGDDTGAYQIDLTGSYDADGLLHVTGELSRSYTFALSTPSLEEVVMKVEPITVNIPEDQYTISATDLVIPVGARSATVTVALNEKFAEDGVTSLGEDLAFIADNVEPMTYELGVRLVNMEGGDVEFEGGSEAKAVLVKEEYVAGLSIATANGNEVGFVRSFSEREILDEEDMTATFRVYLDRPARADVKVNFVTGGLADAFKDDVTLTPAEVIIPAGEKVSEEITWTLTDDFLETTTEPEKHTVTLTAVPTTEDPTVKVLEDQDVITFIIKKIFNILSVLSALDADWTAYDRLEWSAVGKTGDGEFEDASNVLDNSNYSYYRCYSSELVTVDVDMKVSQPIDGIVINHYYKAYASNEVTLKVSDDGVEWNTIGLLEGKSATRYIKLLAPTTARFVRYEGRQTVPYYSYGSYVYYYHYVSDIKVYYKAETTE